MLQSEDDILKCFGHISAYTPEILLIQDLIQQDLLVKYIFLLFNKIETFIGYTLNMLSEKHLRAIAGISILYKKQSYALSSLLLAYNGSYPFVTSEKSREILTEMEKIPIVKKYADKFRVQDDAMALIYRDLQGLCFEIMTVLDVNPDILLTLTSKKSGIFIVKDREEFIAKHGRELRGIASMYSDDARISLNGSYLNRLSGIDYEVINGVMSPIAINTIIHEALHVADYDFAAKQFGLSRTAVYFHAFNIGVTGKYSNDDTAGFIERIISQRNYNLDEFYQEILSHFADHYYSGPFANLAIRPEEMSVPFNIFFKTIVDYGLSLSRHENADLAQKIFFQNLSMGLEDYNKLCKKYGLPENLESGTNEEIKLAFGCATTQASLNIRYVDLCEKFENMCKGMVANIQEEINDKVKML